MISLVPMLILIFIIILLLGLAVGLLILTNKNRLQKTLIGIILLWVMMFVGLLINFIRLYGGVQPPASGVMNFHGIWMGLLGLFSFISYPTVALHEGKISLCKTFLCLSPILLTLGVYIVWHLATGTNMNYRYQTISELWDNRFTIPVILRTLMVVLLITYMTLVLANIWRLIPVCQKYNDDNYADTAYNVEWLRLFIAAMGSICATYLVMLMWKHPFSEIISALTTSAFFVLLTFNAFSRKLFVLGKGVAVDWSFRHGWRLLEKQHVIEGDEEIIISETEIRFNEWIDTQKPYTDPDFTAGKVYALFPELRYPVLTVLLAKRGHTFKSYVRELRVTEACRLMEQNPNSLCKQIALQVGLSSSEVLSRSFTAVTGKSSIEFLKK